MRWVEIINLRSSGTDLDALADRITESFIDTVHDDSPIQIRIYRNPALETDLSIHIHLQTDDARIPSNETGLRLARALEDYGLVDRTLWLEMESSRPVGH